jgi:hypothetical protein
MSIDSIKLFQFIIPSIALVASIISIYIATRNAKRQIRVSKLEEMIETISFLSSYYPSIFWLLNDLKENKRNVKDIEEEVTKFFESVGKETLQTKIFRVRVLANSYLPNGELKAKIISLTIFMSTIYLTVLRSDYFYFKNSYPEGIPEVNSIMDIVASIDEELIREMNLGYKNIDVKTLDKYYKGQFRKELGLK